MSLRFSPIKGSNLLISTGGDKLARLWDTSGNKCIAVLNHHTRYVTSSVFLRHGQFLITGSNDRTAVIWDLNIDNSTTVLDQDYISCEKSINRRNEEIYQLLMNNEFLEATLEASLSGHHSDINNLIFISQNQLISCSSDKTVRHWYLSSSPDFSMLIKSTELNQTCKTDKLIYDVDFCHSSKILVSGDGKIRHMSEEIEIIGSLPVEELFGVIRSCRITLDCKFVLSGGDDDRIYVWDVESLQKIESYEGHEGTIFFIDFVPFKDGVYRIVSGCAMGELKYWIFNPYGDQKSQTLTYVEEAHDLGVNCGAFRHQNESKCEEYYLATGGNDCLIKIWKVDNAHIQPHKSLSGHGGVIMSVSFSKGDSRQLMVSTSGDKTVRLWDGFDFQVLRVLETQCRYVPCSAFSQPLFELDGSKYMYLATGSNDEFISLWKLSGSLVDENIQSFHHTDMKKWSISDVSVWINSLKIKGFNSHIFSESFESLRLDGAQLAHLTREDLLSKFPETFSEPSAAENVFQTIQWRRNKISNPLSEPTAPSYSKVFPPSLVNDETEIPSDLICPITHEIMIHPLPI
uniref:WD repeat, SAM and U-box domain-containing protein 1 n=1 Tax=Lepeophtheirus salmonis TaxID=72036 RepID=A0A0K2SY79_LEPSM